MQIENYLGIQVKKCGLFVDSFKPWLGASPDGIIGDNRLIEIKCPISAIAMTPMEAVSSGTIKYCTLDSEKIVLKRNDKYMFQIQGQLHITGRDTCLFVVWTPKGFSVEEISRDDKFWELKMEEKLDLFYMEALLPIVMKENE